MYPVFPVEFFLLGTPLSLQASGEGLRRWKDEVRAAANKAVGPGAWAIGRAVKVTIYNFPDEPMKGDLDNIVKPILDAMNACVYIDDIQVSELCVRKFDPGTANTFDDVTMTLAAALDAARPLIYVRIDAENYA